MVFHIFVVGGAHHVPVLVPCMLEHLLQDVLFLAHKRQFFVEVVLDHCYVFFGSRIDDWLWYIAGVLVLTRIKAHFH